MPYIKDGIEEVTVVNGTISDDDSDPENDNAQTNEVKMTLNELISGALESAFWAMDKLIVKDREAGYRIRWIKKLYTLYSEISRIFDQNEYTLEPGINAGTMFFWFFIKKIKEKKRKNNRKALIDVKVN